MSTEPEPLDPEPAVAGSDTEEFEERALVRSRERVPELPDACCVSCASVADEPGFVVPNAQMTVCFVSELAYTHVSKGKQEIIKIHAIE